MKEIEIKIILNNEIYSNKKIIIYDKEKIILNTYTNNFGIIKLYGKINCIYKITVFNKNNTFLGILLITKDYNIPYIFYFNDKLNISKKFYLYDKNYKNLKIQGGTLYLWQNNIK